MDPLSVNDSLPPLTDALRRTSWRGMTMLHPPYWELSIASARGEPGRCCFADRTHQRLDVRWRPVTYVPNFDLILSRFRKKTDDDDELEDLDTVPDPWRGLVRNTPAGAVTHAGRFFRARRRLVEVTMVWPDWRDLDLEEILLDSVRPVDEDGPIRSWEAMGLEVDVPARFDVHKHEAYAGQVRWELLTDAKRSPELVIERMAMPEYWLDEALRDWLRTLLPPKSRLVRQDPVTVGPHRGEELISIARAGTLDALRGMARVRLDQAWHCDEENRIYHVSYCEQSRGEEIALPEGLEVRCCRPAPSLGPSRTGE